jgi:hypothetical protein
MFQTRKAGEPGREVRPPGVALAAAPEKARLALFVAHGMGQQIPFETMDAVAEGLARVAREDGKPVGVIRAVTCRIGGRKLQRIEMDLTGAAGKPVELHIYEGYWAPITEGKVRIADVISFLLRAGVNGLRNSPRDFLRWVFGGPVNFGRQHGTWLSLGAALAAVLSLIAANLVVTVLFAGRLAGRMSRGAAQGPAFDDATFTALATLIAGWVIFSVALGVLLGAAHQLKPGRWPKDGRAPQPSAASAALTIFLWVVFGLWLLYTIAIGIVPLLALAGVRVDGFGLRFFNEYSVWVWAGLIAVSALVRKLMIQFPGDVAAYCSTQTLDRFLEIRSKIKEWVGQTARAIYESGEYEGVAWVGHSLGSVVVYDALNALIMDDELDQRRLRVVERTRLLLTFGSPLDKIAFIFGSQWARTTETREALTASFQPLILDYERFRSLRWVNIYAPADIISGALDFYDQRDKSTPPHVDNVPDPAATTPLLAHIEYWKNRLLFEKLYEGLLGAATAPQAKAPPRLAA